MCTFTAVSTKGVQLQNKNLHAKAKESHRKVNVGYRQSAKIWLISNEDLRHMYSVTKGCGLNAAKKREVAVVMISSSKKKSSTKRQKIEDEVEKISLLNMEKLVYTMETVGKNDSVWPS